MNAVPLSDRLGGRRRAAGRALACTAIVIATVGAMTVPLQPAQPSRESGAVRASGDVTDFSSFWLAAWWIRERPPIPLYYPFQARGQPNSRIWAFIRDAASAPPLRPWQAWGARHDYPAPKFYLYPPIFALAMAPLTLLPVGAALIVWNAVSLIAFACAMTLLSVAWSPKRRGAYVWAALLAGLSAISYPVLWTLRLNQNSLVLLLLWAAMLWSLERRRETLAGVMLGSLAMVKLSPVLLLPWLVWRRCFRTVAVGAGTMAALALLSIGVAGFDQVRLYFTALLPLLSYGTHYVENQSLLGLLLRLQSENDLTAPPAVTTLPSPWLWWGALGALIAVQVWGSIRRAGASPLAFRADACSWMMLLLLISPVSWSHHYVNALMPLLLCGQEVLGLRGGKRIVFLAVACVCFVLIAMPSLPDDWSRHPTHSLPLSFRFFGGLTLWLTLNLWPGFNPKPAG